MHDLHIKKLAGTEIFVVFLGSRCFVQMHEFYIMKSEHVSKYLI